LHNKLNLCGYKSQRTVCGSEHSPGFKTLEVDSVKITPDKLDWLTAPTTCSRLQTRHILCQSPLKCLQVYRRGKQLYQQSTESEVIYFTISLFLKYW